jgi:hypothetical protein
MCQTRTLAAPEAAATARARCLRRFRRWIGSCGPPCCRSSRGSPRRSETQQPPIPERHQRASMARAFPSDASAVPKRSPTRSQLRGGNRVVNRYRRVIVPPSEPTARIAQEPPAIPGGPGTLYWFRLRRVRQRSRGGLWRGVGDRKYRERGAICGESVDAITSQHHIDNTIACWRRIQEIRLTTNWVIKIDRSVQDAG